MAYVVLKAKRYEDANLLHSDDLVSRQTIRVYDLRNLGLEDQGFVILVEGSEEAVNRAVQLLNGIAEKIEGEEAKKIYEKIKEMEDAASSGFGSIFGRSHSQHSRSFSYFYFVNFPIFSQDLFRIFPYRKDRVSYHTLRSHSSRGPYFFQGLFYSL